MANNDKRALGPRTAKAEATEEERAGAAAEQSCVLLINSKDKRGVFETYNTLS
jgi:hypothetical protein